MDSKGRISIPSDIRRSFGLETGDIVCIFYDLKENVLFLAADGQDGVTASTKGCGPLSSSSTLDSGPARRNI